MATIYEASVKNQQGEFVSRKLIRTTKISTEAFVRAYIKDIGVLAKCNGAEIKVILCSLNYLDYDTNEIVLNTQRRKEIMSCGDLKLSTFNNALSKLKSKNILILDKGKIILNPKLFFYGSDLAKLTKFELTLEYNIEAIGGDKFSVKKKLKESLGEKLDRSEKIEF